VDIWLQPTSLKGKAFIGGPAAFGPNLDKNQLSFTYATIFFVDCSPTCPPQVQGVCVYEHDCRCGGRLLKSRSGHPPPNNNNNNINNKKNTASLANRLLT